MVHQVVICPTIAFSFQTNAHFFLLNLLKGPPNLWQKQIQYEFTNFRKCPVGDLAQHTLSAILYYTVNHLPIFDDIVKKQIPGIDKYDKIVDTKNPIPLTYLEQYNISELITELSASCYIGMLLLQAMGLGGWMYDGVDRHTVLGADRRS